VSANLVMVEVVVSAEPAVFSDGVLVGPVPSVVGASPRRRLRHGLRHVGRGTALLLSVAVPVFGVLAGAVLVMSRRSVLGALMITVSTMSTIWYAAAYLESR
jgi:hypothetical protein